MKLKIIDYFLISFFILLIVIFFIALKYYQSEGNKCLNDPLEYSQKRLGNSFTCSCSRFENGNYITYFANKDITPKNNPNVINPEIKTENTGIQ